MRSVLASAIPRSYGSTMQRNALTGLLLALAVVTLAPSIADAQTRRSGPLFASAGVGPFVYFDWDASFRLEGQFGWHPGGHDEGFFIAADVAFSIERYYAMVYGGARFGGDIEVFQNNDLAILLTPSGLAGFGWVDHGRGFGGYGFFLLQPSFAVNVALFERVLWLWAQPVGFDLLFFPDRWRNGSAERGFVFDWGYNFMAGARFNFG